MSLTSFPLIWSIKYYNYSHFLLNFGVASVALVKPFTNLWNALAKYSTQVVPFIVNVILLFSACGRKMFHSHCTLVLYDAMRWCNVLNTCVFCALLSYSFVLLSF